MLQWFLEWADLHDVEIDASVQRALDEWDLQAGWTVLCPTLRHWAGSLIDDGFGVYGVGGVDAADAARSLVNGGTDAYLRVVGALPAEPPSSGEFVHI